MIRHALIFAAGQGARMHPLTERTPKPLLPLAGKPLLVWQLEKLAKLGVREVVINTSHLAECFEPLLGDGGTWGLRLHYSYEGPTALETGGGMLHALPKLGDGPFIAVAGDVWSDYNYAKLPVEPAGLAHLVMVPNPSWHPQGDFLLHAGQLRLEGPGQWLTFGSIGVYRPEFIATWPPGRFSLLPVYQQAIAQNALSGECYTGSWHNLGTPAQLAELDRQLRQATGGELTAHQPAA